MSDWIGWVATVVFALSYVSRNPVTLRRVQASAAVLWISYGIAVKAAPVIVANGVVAGMALLSTRRKVSDKAAAELPQ